MKIALLSIAYILLWSVIPACDKLALRSAQQHALTWTVFMLCFLFLSTYVFVFTESPKETIGAALYNPYTIASSLGTTLVYLLYFYLLQERGVVYIVVLQPAILVFQTAFGVFLFKEPIDRWNVAGGIVIGVGMVLYNVTSILNLFRCSSCSTARLSST